MSFIKRANHSIAGHCDISNISGTSDICAPNASSWVLANAGTGKTYILVSRLLVLLLRGVKLEHILCLTYTKNAAANMKKRLFDVLSNWALLDKELLAQDIKTRLDIISTPEELTRAKHLFAYALQAKGEVKIQTIHSFCHSLLNRFMLEAHMPPHFKLMSDVQKTQLRQKAIENILLRAQEDQDSPLGQAIRLLTSQYDKSSFDSLAQQLLEAKKTKNDSKNDGIEMDDEEHLSSRKDRLSEQKNRELKKTQQTCMKHFHKPLARLRKNIIEAKGITLKPTDIKTCHRIAHFERFLDIGGDNIEQTPLHLQWLAFCEIFYTQSHTIRKNLFTKEVYASSQYYEFCKMLPVASQAKEWLEDKRWKWEKMSVNEMQEGAIRDERQEAIRKAITIEAIRKVITIEDKRRKMFVDEMQNAISIFKHFLFQYIKEEKTAQRLVDYDDLIESACELLSETSKAQFVLYQLDERIDHILIDESQDTSPAQWRVIELIAEEFFAGLGSKDEHARSLFCVGDEKQSIFSFQGADIDVFEKTKKMFERKITQAQKPFTKPFLETSRRSCQEILTFVDKVCAHKDMTSALAKSTSPISHKAHRKDKGYIELWDYIAYDKKQDKEADNDETKRKPFAPYQEMAKRVAKKIETLITSSQGAIKPKDILILLQKREPLMPALMRELHKHHLPAQGRDRFKINEQIAALDLLAACQLACLPKDNLNFANYLKSPLGGFDDDDLLHLTDKAKGGSLFSLLQQHIKGKTMPKHKELVWQKAYDNIKSLLAKADFVPVFEFLNFILIEQEGRKKLLLRLGQEANDVLDALLNIALEFEARFPSSLEGFLSYARQLDDDIKREIDEEEDLIRVMTIYGAKGLEAPIVFLPDTMSVKSQYQQAKEFFAQDEKAKPIWLADKVHNIEKIDKHRQARKQKIDEEYKRLLYVALTRARDRLYIGGYLGKNANKPDDDKGGQNNKAMRSWYQIIRQVMEEEQAKKHIKGQTEKQVQEQTREQPKGQIRNEKAKEPNPSKWRKKQTDEGLIWCLGEETELASKHSAPKDSQHIIIPKWAKTKHPLPPPQEIASPSHISPLKKDTQIRTTQSQLAQKKGQLIHQLLEGLSPLPSAIREERGRIFLEHQTQEDEPTRDLLLKEVLGLFHSKACRLFLTRDARREVPIAGLLDLPHKGKTHFSGIMDVVVEEEERLLLGDFKSDIYVPKSINEVHTAYLAQIFIYKKLLEQIYPQKPILPHLIWTKTAYVMRLPPHILDKVGATL